MVTTTDEEIEKETGISRETHENRNQHNELPTGMVKPIDDECKFYEDNDGRVWRRNPDIHASYHQPMPLAVAAVRSVLAPIFFGFGKVPNLKFMSPNVNGGSSEFCVNRYTGEMVVDQQLMGTYNFANDEPDFMEKGALSNGGEHRLLDIIPHEEYGGNYKHYAKEMPIGSLENIPILLQVEE